ncbi:MAG: tetratricopeptide repeat protein [Vicinamibacterales bacterium]
MSTDPNVHAASMTAARQARRLQFVQLYLVAGVFTLVPYTAAWFAPRLNASSLGATLVDSTRGATETPTETETLSAVPPADDGGGRQAFVQALTQAHDALIHNRLDAAIERADDALRIDPASMDARGLKANALFERYWVNKSDADLQAARSLTDDVAASTAPHALVARGNRALAEGHPEQAVALLAGAAVAGPNDPYVQHQYGFALNAAKQPERAVTYLAQALQLTPDMAWVQENLKDVLTRLERCDEPIPGLHAEVVADCSNEVGVKLYGARRPQEAVARFERAVTLAPENGVYHANLAAALLAIGQREEALQHAQQARERGVTDHPALRQLAQ